MSEVIAVTELPRAALTLLLTVDEVGKQTVLATKYYHLYKLWQDKFQLQLHYYLYQVQEDSLLQHYSAGSIKLYLLRLDISIHIQSPIETEQSVGYIGVGRGEIDVGIFGICDSTPFSIWIVGCGKIAKVSSCPCINSNCKNDSYKNEVDDKTTAVGTIPSLNCIRWHLLGTIGSLIGLSELMLLI